MPRSDMVFSPAGTVSKQVTGMSAQQEHQAEADVAQSQNTMVIFACRSNHLLSTRARKHCLRVTAIRGTSRRGSGSSRRRDTIGRPLACTIGGGPIGPGVIPLDPSSSCSIGHDRHIEARLAQSKDTAMLLRGNVESARATGWNPLQWWEQCRLHAQHRRDILFFFFLTEEVDHAR